MAYIHPEFLIIVITPPDFLDNEEIFIRFLLDNGVDYVHIRKPGAECIDLEELIRRIPPEYRPRLKLHDCYGLCNKYGLGGIQINSRNHIPDVASGKISYSCHSVQEIESLAGYEYVTLSPIFDSISKSEYKSRFTSEALKGIHKLRGVVAMGGITPVHFDTLHQTGFAGAALLGYIWKGYGETDFMRVLSEKTVEISNALKSGSPMSKGHMQSNNYKYR